MSFTFNLNYNLPMMYYETHLSKGALLINLGLIIIPSLICVALKLMLAILTPWDYEKDMTTSEFCNLLAEVDNDLKLQKNHSGSARIRKTKQPIKEKLADLSCSDLEDLLSDTDLSSTEAGSAKQKSSFNHLGSLKHIYPNGWLPVLESAEVKPGSFEKTIIMGRDVIVTRSMDGQQVKVLSAYCSHIGAHLGVGGAVVTLNGELCIKCPFHGWTYRFSDGSCVDIPYQRATNEARIPKQAHLESWITEEQDNFIYIWHHIDNIAPTWQLESMPQISKLDWQLACRSVHTLNADVRDMHENGGDINHFQSIHEDFALFGTRWEKFFPKRLFENIVSHQWNPSWYPIMEENGSMSHKAVTKVDAYTVLLGKRYLKVEVSARQIGPARVNLLYNSLYTGKGMLVMHAVPIGGRRTKLVQHVYISHTSLLSSIRAKIFLFGELTQLERDIIVWNHKKPIENPILISEDKVLRQFRLWYSQFYKRKKTVKITWGDRLADSGKMTRVSGDT